MFFQKKFFFFLLLFTLVIYTVASAQMPKLYGTVNDEMGHSLPGAGVSILSISDSSLIETTVADTLGKFRFSSLDKGGVLLKISYVSFADFFTTINVDDKPYNAGILALKVKTTSLKAINIDAKTPPVQAKGDTMQYNADAFKVNKDATAEDLVTKMPGVTLQDGKVQAQGEEVKKVLVDGKPFLGDDANAALKNLPAEAIDKVQVYDRKSDQSTFTGFDDGNTTKTMNIITRPQFRNGTFGKVFSGYGTEDLWKDGFNVNFFKDKRKLSLLGNANKINEQNFSADDLLGVVGTNAGGRPQGGGRGNFGNRQGGGRNVQQNELSPFLVDQKNGIATTYSAGINYTNQLKKLNYTFSYFYNQTENNSNGDLFRQYFTGTDALNYRETSSGKTTNENHRANLSLDYKFDTLRSLLIQPKISFQKNSGNSSQAGINNGVNGQLSEAVTEYRSDINGYNFSSPILYRHSFLKKGRTFSANFNPAYNENKGESGLISYTTYTNDTLPKDSLNQVTDPLSHGWNNSTELTYTEPLNKETQLSFTYKNYYSLSNSDKQTFSYSPSDALYNQLDTSLSNTFQNTYFSQSLGTSYRYQVEKWNFMAGISYQKASMKNEQTFPYVGKTDKNFENILPNAMFQYRFTTKKNLRIFYRSNNNTPSVSQLQNVLNNNNPLQLSIGNPSLKQDWQNFINLRYSAVNSEKNTSFTLYTNFSVTSDYLGNSTTIASGDSIVVEGIVLANGSQLSKPVNLNGYYNFRFFANYSFPVKKIKSNLNINSNWSNTRTPSLINGAINYSTMTASGLGISLSSNISEKYDFTISSNAALNNITNSIQGKLNSDYYNINSRFKIQVMPWKGLLIQTDLNHQYNSGLSTSYNQEYLLWNASLGYKFLKNRVAEIRISAIDLLNKNTNITRNTTEVYYEDIRYNQLQRYFLVTFTYNLKFFKIENK